MVTPGDLHVALDRLAASARAARALADSVRSLDLGGPVRAAGAALPGSATSGAAGDLAGRWSRSATAVTDALAAQASSLEGSASSYRESDGTVAQDFQSPSPASPQGGPGPGAITRALS